MTGFINFLFTICASTLIFQVVSSDKIQTTQRPTNYSVAFQSWKVSHFLLKYKTGSLIKFFFQKYYNKVYGNSSLEATAFQNFKTNLINIQTHNTLPNKTYKQGLSWQSDLSFAEIKKLRMGFKINQKASKLTPKDVVDDYPAHASVDYTRYFPKAKNQKNCSACSRFDDLEIRVVEFKFSFLALQLFQF